MPHKSFQEPTFRPDCKWSTNNPGKSFFAFVLSSVVETVLVSFLFSSFTFRFLNFFVVCCFMLIWRKTETFVLIWRNFLETLRIFFDKNWPNVAFSRKKWRFHAFLNRFHNKSSQFWNFRKKSIKHTVRPKKIIHHNHKTGIYNRNHRVVLTGGLQEDVSRIL